MSNIHSKYKDKEGNTLTISYDLDPESPREWDGNIGQFLFPNDSKYTHWEEDCLTYNLDDIVEEFIAPGTSKSVTVKEILEKYLNDNYVKWYPLYKYEHSGIVLSLSPFSCPFDSGQIGWYVVTEKTIDEIRLTDDPVCDNYIKDMCEKELITFNQYLSGEVYGYTYTSTDGEEDSCWGYYDIDDILHQFPGMEIVNEGKRRIKLEN